MIRNLIHGPFQLGPIRTTRFDPDGIQMAHYDLCRLMSESTKLSTDKDQILGNEDVHFAMMLLNPVDVPAEPRDLRNRKALIPHRGTFESITWNTYYRLTLRRHFPILFCPFSAPPVARDAREGPIVQGGTLALQNASLF